jgi:hypothetical protein
VAAAACAVVKGGPPGVWPQIGGRLDGTGGAVAGVQLPPGKMLGAYVEEEDADAAADVRSVEC